MRRNPELLRVLLDFYLRKASLREAWALWASRVINFLLNYAGAKEAVVARVGGRKLVIAKVEHAGSPEKRAHVKTRAEVGSRLPLDYPFLLLVVDLDYERVMKTWRNVQCRITPLVVPKENIN